MLTVFSIAVGTATIIAILGVAQTSANQVTERLEVLGNSTSTIELSHGMWNSTDQWFQGQIESFGVEVELGTFTALPGDGQSKVSQLLDVNPVEVQIVIATQEGLRVRGAALQAGSYVSDGFSSHGESSVLIGSGLARTLDLSVSSGRNILKLDSRVLTVSGILTDNDRESLLENSLVVTPAVAELLGLLPQQRTFLVETESTESVEAVLSAAWSLPSYVFARLTSSAAASDYVNDVAGETGFMVLLVSTITWLLGSLGTYNSMQVALRERATEIGIRRAMGVSKQGILAQFFFESVFVSIVSTLLGWVMGVTVSAYSAEISTSELVFPASVWLVPVMGFAIGLLGGLVAALRLSRLDPIVLIRATS